MTEPTREEVDKLRGAVVLEFGAAWCSHCRAIQAQMRTLLARHQNVQHIRVEDGPGRPLGRSFRVKLWPTLVFMRDGNVVSIAVRPAAREIEKGFAELLGDEEAKP